MDVFLEMSTHEHVNVFLELSTRCGVRCFHYMTHENMALGLYARNGVRCRNNRHGSCLQQQDLFAERNCIYNCGASVHSDLSLS